MSKTKSEVTHHVLVPTHEKISDKEKQDLLKRYNITIKELPMILNKDPAIESLMLKDGDVVKIARASRTAGETIFYRRVINA
ncbi:DNA-directed RNA polymerase subunit H [Candidatus Woesearchaeota archaeon]|nr:DNA-directed RNA polymerase subunit H [Candidatus Woesearchaeota archaeon]